MTGSGSYEDTLITDGSSLLLADDADDTNDDESQISALLCFYLRGLIQRKPLVRFASVLPFVICNIFEKKFGLSTFNRDAFFRLRPVT
jgi:pectate lyase